MAVGVAAAYVPRQGGPSDMLLAGLVVLVVNLPSAVAWTGSGVALRRLLARPGALRIFNGTMAALLVASLVPVLIEVVKAWG